VLPANGGLTCRPRCRAVAARNVSSCSGCSSRSSPVRDG
jgi:hypothetical protein